MSKDFRFLEERNTEDSRCRQRTQKKIKERKLSLSQLLTNASALNLLAFAEGPISNPCLHQSDSPIGKEVLIEVSKVP